MDKTHLLIILESGISFLFQYTIVVILLSAILAFQYGQSKLFNWKSSWFGVINKLGSPYKYLSFPVVIYVFAFVGCSSIGFWVVLNHLSGLPLEELMLFAIACQALSFISFLCTLVCLCVKLIRHSFVANKKISL